MKRPYLAPKPLKRKRATVKPKRGSGGKLGAKKGIPAWLRAIPEGSHGSGTLQKRLWRLKSDYVRIRDFLEFGTFVDTGERIEDWNHAQAGHYRSYNECNGMFKFHWMNIHAQSPKGNSFPTSTTWEKYKETLVYRYGKDIIGAIDQENKVTPLKITNLAVLAEIEDTIGGISRLAVKPPYWDRLMKLRA